MENEGRLLQLIYLILPTK